MTRRRLRSSALATLATVSMALCSCDSGNVQGSVSVGMYYGTSFYDPWMYGPGYGYGGYYPPGGAVITPVPPGGVRPPGGVGPPGGNRPVATPLPSTRPAGGYSGGGMGGGGGRRR